MLADKRILIPAIRDVFLILALFTTLVLNSRFEFITLILILMNLIFWTKDILKKQFKRAKITLRLLVNIALIGAIYMALSFLFRFLVINLLLSILSIYLVLAVNEATKLIIFAGHRWKMRQASKLLESIDGLESIGITGSYGKSATKLFLNKILQQEFKIISTPGSINTDIGIANIILKHLANLTDEQKQNYSYAVLEMDAYMIGTLKRVTSYYPLDIAMITSVNEQHLETFKGSIENTKEGIYQILQGFKPDSERIAVFNYDNKNCKELSKRYFDNDKLSKYKHGQIYSYGSEESCDVSVQNLENKPTPEGNILKFDLRFSKKLGRKTLEIKLPLLGDFNAVNFAGAALVAKLCGVKDENIIKAASLVELKPKTLKLHKLSKNLELIDDSYSANPAGVMANLKMLDSRNKKFPAKTLVLFPGIVDLSKRSEQIHAEIGKKLDIVSDKVIITDKLYGQQVTKKVSQGKKVSQSKENNKFIIEEDTEKVNQIIKDFIQQNSDDNIRILITGRVPFKIYNYIKNL
jgi:UDP-N-acetylmuramoyl-tripeptide--D-alanyl-D-alanine ligase